MHCVLGLRTHAQSVSCTVSYMTTTVVCVPMLVPMLGPAECSQPHSGNLPGAITMDSRVFQSPSGSLQDYDPSVPSLRPSADPRVSLGLSCIFSLLNLTKDVPASFKTAPVLRRCPLPTRSCSVPQHNHGLTWCWTFSFPPDEQHNSGFLIPQRFCTDF